MRAEIVWARGERLEIEVADHEEFSRLCEELIAIQEASDPVLMGPKLMREMPGALQRAQNPEAVMTAMETLVENRAYRGLPLKTATGTGVLLPGAIIHITAILLHDKP